MPNDTQIDLQQTVAALRQELEATRAERTEALARQSATSEILRVISRSPSDIRPVFEAIVARAAQLCEAEFSVVARFEDGLLHLVALHSMSPEEAAAAHSTYPLPFHPGAVRYYREVGVDIPGSAGRRAPISKDGVRGSTFTAPGTEHTGQILRRANLRNYALRRAR